MVLELFTAFAALPQASILWAGLGAAGLAVIQKVLPSSTEKKTHKREDFSAITNALFKEIEVLKGEIHRYKQDSENCENQYEELNYKFIEFKKSYNELELRYSIQIKINKKLADEISRLEDEIRKHLEKENNLIVNDRQEQSLGDSEKSSDREPR
jgi:chromosome segregation ATPase